MNNQQKKLLSRRRLPTNDQDVEYERNDNMPNIIETTTRIDIKQSPNMSTSTSWNPVSTNISVSSLPDVHGKKKRQPSYTVDRQGKAAERQAQAPSSRSSWHSMKPQRFGPSGADRYATYSQKEPGPSYGIRLSHDLQSQQRCNACNRPNPSKGNNRNLEPIPTTNTKNMPSSGEEPQQNLPIYRKLNFIKPSKTSSNAKSNSDTSLSQNTVLNENLEHAQKASVQPSSPASPQEDDKASDTSSGSYPLIEDPMLPTLLDNLRKSEELSTSKSSSRQQDETHLEPDLKSKYDASGQKIFLSEEKDTVTHTEKEGLNLKKLTEKADWALSAIHNLLQEGYENKDRVLGETTPQNTNQPAMNVIIFNTNIGKDGNGPSFSGSNQVNLSAESKIDLLSIIGEKEKIIRQLMGALEGTEFPGHLSNEKGKHKQSVDGDNIHTDAIRAGNNKSSTSAVNDNDRDTNNDLVKHSNGGKLQNCRDDVDLAERNETATNVNKNTKDETNSKAPISNSKIVTEVNRVPAGISTGEDANTSRTILTTVEGKENIIMRLLKNVREALDLVIILSNEGVESHMDVNTVTDYLRHAAVMNSSDTSKNIDSSEATKISATEDTAGTSTEVDTNTKSEVSTSVKSEVAHASVDIGVATNSKSEVPKHIETENPECTQTQASERNESETSEHVECEDAASLYSDTFTDCSSETDAGSTKEAAEDNSKTNKDGVNNDFQSKSSCDDTPSSAHDAVTNNANEDVTGNNNSDAPSFNNNNNLGAATTSTCNADATDNEKADAQRSVPEASSTRNDSETASRGNTNAGSGHGEAAKRGIKTAASDVKDVFTNKDTEIPTKNDDRDASRVGSTNTLSKDRENRFTTVMERLKEMEIVLIDCLYPDDF